MTTGGIIDELRRRLTRYPRDRYPVQHATTQFHLGQALLQAEQPSAAIDAFRISLAYFPPPLVVERAKVLNLLGAALRSLSQFDAAAEAFQHAGAVFAAQGLTAEHGAALFNLGLVQRDVGDSRAAAETFAAAREHLGEGPLGPRAMAALQHGGALLEAGEPERAVDVLTEAVAVAERAGDRETLGGAANTLGLANLACHRTCDAIASFGLAVAAHPRSVRPAGYGMAKANLALAHEQAGDPAGARLAAQQALGTPDVPPTVQAQAAATLQRVGSSVGSTLLMVLDNQPVEQWPATVRDEVARWAAIGPDERHFEAVAWIEGLAPLGGDAAAAHHAWLSALLELAPADLNTIIRAILDAAAALDPAVTGRFRAATGRAMALFPVPQLLRLRNCFNTLAVELGQEAAWN